MPWTAQWQEMQPAPSRRRSAVRGVDGDEASERCGLRAWCVDPRVKDVNTYPAIAPRISRRDSHSMNERRRRDQTIECRQRVGDRDSRPQRHDRLIHCEDTIGKSLADRGVPAFKPFGLWLVSSGNQLDSAPNLSQNNDTREDKLGGQLRKPLGNARVRIASAFQLGNNIRVDQDVHSSTSRTRPSVGSFRSRSIWRMTSSHNASPCGDNGSFIANASNALIACGGLGSKPR
jgi:hypothetical protein